MSNCFGRNLVFVPLCISLVLSAAELMLRFSHWAHRSQSLCTNKTTDDVSMSGSLKTELTTPPNGCCDDNYTALKGGDCQGQGEGPQILASMWAIFTWKFEKWKWGRRCACLAGVE